MSRIKQIVAVVNVSVSKDVTMTQSVKCYDEDGDEVSRERIKLDTNKIKVKIGLSRTKIVPFKVDTKGSPKKDMFLEVLIISQNISRSQDRKKTWTRLTVSNW